MLFDWFRRGRREGEPEGPNPRAWRVFLDGGDVVAEDDHGHAYRATVGAARNVRVVPMGRGDHHMTALQPGWQVALARPDGDVLLGTPQADWQSARELARLVCEKTELRLDELTQRMFSRVGQFTPKSTS